MITNVKDVNATNLKGELDHIAQRLNLSDINETQYFPKYLQLETVRVCDARCPFCAIDQWDKSTPLMSDKLFEKIVSELAGYSHWIEAVCIQRAGEPLLDKKLGPRIKMLKDAGIKKVTMSTNASQLNQDKAIELLEAGLDDIMLSIDSIDKEAYEKIRIGLSFENVMNNIQGLFAVRDEIKPELIVRVRGVSFHDLNEEQGSKELERWEDFWGKFKKPQDRIYMKQLHNWGNQVDLNSSKTGPGNGYYNDIFHPCILPWSTMHITAMGIIALCSMDYDAKFSLGDLNHESITDVWRSDKWALIRGLHKSGNRNELAMCRGCKLFDLDFSLENKDNVVGIHES